MLLIIALIFVATLGKGVSEQSISILKGTKELNYTFYHIHTYPEPENMTIYIYFRQTGNELHSLLSSFAKALQKIEKSTIKLANKPKPTFIDQQPILSDFGSQQLVLSSTIVLEVLDENNLALIVEQIQQISKEQSIQIASIQREYWNLFDYQVQEAKARTQVQQKGRQICEKYFAMRFKRLQYFQKQRTDLEEQYNQTDGFDEESEQFIGNLGEVYDEIDMIENQQRFIKGNEVFKCSIICENIKLITQQDVQKLIKKGESNKRQPKKENSNVSKKSKKINLQKYQKQLLGTEL